MSIKIRLIPLNKKSKNVTLNIGEIWFISRIQKKVSCLNDKSGMLLILDNKESFKKWHGLWVEFPEKNNFELETILKVN